VRAHRSTIIYIINIPIYILPTDQSVQPRRQVYGACGRLYVCGVRGKNLTETHPPASVPHHPPWTILPFITPRISPVARNYVHPIEFLYRGKRTKRELRAYNICIILYVCIRSLRAGRLSSGVLLMGGVVGYGNSKSASGPPMSFIHATYYYRQLNRVCLYYTLELCPTYTLNI